MYANVERFSRVAVSKGSTAGKMHLLESNEGLHRGYSDCSFKPPFSEGDQSLLVVGMNGFVVFAVCIAQDVDTAPCRDPGHDHTHD